MSSRLSFSAGAETVYIHAIEPAERGRLRLNVEVGVREAPCGSTMVTGLVETYHAPPARS